MADTRGLTLGLLYGLALAVLAGCATVPTWAPGDPDDLTREHWELAVKAVDAKSKTDAQAAMDLLEKDITRMRTNSMTQAAAFTKVSAVTKAVDKGDWGTAHDALENIWVSYGRK